jgi:hypothetical protein
MSKYLCKVDRVFQLAGRLVIVADTLYDDFDKGWRHGATVELRRTDGTSIRTRTWMETASPTNIGRPMAFSVEKTLTKADVPEGSEVWLMQEQQSKPEQLEKPAQRRHSA